MFYLHSVTMLPLTITPNFSSHQFHLASLHDPPRALFSFSRSVAYLELDKVATNEPPEWTPPAMQHLRRVHRAFVARRHTALVTSLAMLPLRPLARGGSSLATGWGLLWMLKPDCLAVRTHSPISAVEQGTTNLPDLEPECAFVGSSLVLFCVIGSVKKQQNIQNTQKRRRKPSTTAFQYSSRVFQLWRLWRSVLWHEAVVKSLVFLRQSESLSILKLPKKRLVWDLVWVILESKDRSD